MRIRSAALYALDICVIATMLAGCGGSQIGAPPGAQQGAATAGHTGHGSPKGRAGSGTAFTVSGRTIMLNDQPFYIKGVDYGNTQIDAYSDPNPLDDANEPIWAPDLTAMRAAGANSVKVYNVSLKSFQPYVPDLGNGNKLKGYETGKIDKFLNAAWNGGDHPVYVVLSVFFGGDDVFNAAKLRALRAVYELMAKEYAAKPAVMGISLGSEINSESLINQPNWWRALNGISDSITKGYKEAGAQKIITTTMVDMVKDGQLSTVVAGEKNGFKLDAWGIDSYRGYTFSNIWKQIEEATKRPEIMAEYGASAGWWTQSTATYDESSHSCPKDTYPPNSFGKDAPPYWGLPPGPPPPWEFVKELPTTGNPKIQFLANQVSANANELFEHSVGHGGVGSGGFYFEWNDEWSKAGWPHSHIGGFPGNLISPTPPFPSCYWDEAWFGLTSDKPVDRQYKWPGNGNPFPARPPDKHEPRPTLDAIKAAWAAQ